MCLLNIADFILRIDIKGCFTEDKDVCDYQRDLTTVSSVYSEDPVVHQKAALLNLLVYSMTDSVLSGVRGLISELKPEQHNLHL